MPDTAPADAAPEDGGPRVVVLAPLLYLTITIEQETNSDGVHIHPGGQGFWIARMLESLGCRVSLAAPVGGEVGDVLAGLLPGWGIELERADMAASSPAYVHDRRTGERVEIVMMPEPTLNRHESDDLYGAILHAGLNSDGCVLTSGGDGLLSDGSYTRLVTDLSAAGVPIFADIHGPALHAALSGGRLRALKVSDEDLAADGWKIDGPRQTIAAARELAEKGADTVVISRAGDPAIAVVGDRAMTVTPPRLTSVDHRGAGDSMTGGLAAGALLGLDPIDALRLGAAAGAGNVTRRGLGSGTPELISALTERVEIEDIARD